MNLDDIRLKEVDELSAEEKGFLGKNWGKLTDEEKDYFGPAKTEADDSFKFPFKSQDELDKHIQELADKRYEERLQSEQEDKKQKEAESKGETFFPKDYKAKDWNEPAQVLAEKIEERVIKKIQSMNAEQRSKLEQINKEFDAEYETIASNNKSVPAKGTPEREDWEAEVAQIGAKYKLIHMTDAYEVWKALNSNKPPETPKADLFMEGKRDIASKVGKGFGTGTSPAKTTYKVGGGMRLDDILEKRKAEEGIID